MTLYEQNLEAICEIMADQSPTIQAEYRLDRIAAEFEELPLKDRIAFLIERVHALCELALSNNHELVDRKLAGTLVCRTELLAGVLMQKDASELKRTKIPSWPKHRIA